MVKGLHYAGGGGHSIKNDSGTSLAQKDNLQFKGTYSINDGDDSVVNVTRTMTSQQYSLLSAEEKKGIINVTDETGNSFTAADIAYDSDNSVKDRIDNINRSIAPVENGNTATSYHGPRTHFIFKGSRVIATLVINVGDTITIGTNCVYDTIENNLNTITPKTVGNLDTQAKIDGLEANSIIYSWVTATVSPFSTQNWATVQTVGLANTVLNQTFISINGIAFRHWEDNAWSAWKKVSFS